MGSIQTVRDVVRPHEFLSRWDFQYAYAHLPTSIHTRRLLRVNIPWRNLIIQFISLPFGLSSAPRLFTKILKEPVRYLRSRGHRMVVFLDDLLFASESYEKAQAKAQEISSLFSSLDFIINRKNRFSSQPRKTRLSGLHSGHLQDGLSRAFPETQGTLS